MVDERDGERDGPALAAPPGKAVCEAVRAMCRRLYAVEDEFVAGFRASLAQLVPGLQHSTPDQGGAIAEGLARAVLWAGLTTDPPEVVEETFRNVGAEYSRRGFPPSGYHGAGHALLRAAREIQISEWTSELSSAWVAYYSWLSSHLADGAERARPAPAPGLAGPPRVTGPPSLAGPPGPAGAPAPPAPLEQSLGPALGQPLGPAVGQPLGPAVGRPLGQPVGQPAGQATAPPPAEAFPFPPTTTSPPADQAPGPPARPRQRLELTDPAGGADAGSGPAAGGADPTSLDEVLDLLRTRYFAGNERALGAIVTRVALRTGADLRAPRPDQRTNPAVIANVIAVLQVMGYVLHAGGSEAVERVIASPQQAEPRARWWNRRKGGMLRGWRSVSGTTTGGPW